MRDPRVAAILGASVALVSAIGFAQGRESTPGNQVPTERGATGAQSIASSASSASGATSAVTIGDNNTIRLPLQNTSGDVSVLVVISNIPSGPLRTTAPSVIDAGLTGNAKVTFGQPQQVQNDSTVGWLFKATVTALPAGASDSHVAKVTLDKQLYMRIYTLTNRAVGTQTWSVVTPGVPWIVNWIGLGLGAESPLTLIVAAQDVPVRGIHLAQSMLRDDKNLVAINRNDLEFVSTTDLNVPAHSTGSFDVRLKSHGLLSAHGKFTGNIQLGADSMADLQTAAVTLYATSVWMRLFGAVLIFVGVRISRALLHELRPRIARAQALRPVILARQRGASLVIELDTLSSKSQPFPLTRKRLVDVQNSLSVKVLDNQNLLPRASDLSIAAAVDSTDKLQQLLTSVSTTLDAVATVMRNGMAPAVDDLADNRYVVADVKTALKELDKLGDTTQSRGDAVTKIATLLATYREPAPAARPAAILAVARKIGTDPTTIAQANYIIEHASNVGWILIEGITVAVGLVLLVLPNPGFAWIDAVYCLLWGVGIPTAGATFQSMTPSTVATNIGVGVSKIGA